MNISYVNGKWLENSHACVSICERGFRFGDGVFETIPIHAGRPYLWEYHLERLHEGLTTLAITPLDCDLRAVAEQLLARTRQPDGILRLSVSRGIGGRGYLPAPEMKPTVVMEWFERPAPPENPVTLWLSSIEKISPRALPTQFKLSQGVNSTLARMEAAQNRCHDALQLDAQGHIAEAAAATIFWLRDTILHTPSLATGALAGVTRRRVMELSPYPVREGLYTLTDIAAAEAVVITNAALGIVAVNRLLPEDCVWNSTDLAVRLNGLRDEDITSLART